MLYQEAKELKESLPDNSKEPYMRFVVVPKDNIDYYRYIRYLAMAGDVSDETAKIFSFDNQFSVARVGEKNGCFYHQIVNEKFHKFLRKDSVM